MIDLSLHFKYPFLALYAIILTTVFLLISLLENKKESKIRNIIFAVLNIISITFYYVINPPLNQPSFWVTQGINIIILLLFIFINNNKIFYLNIITMPVVHFGIICSLESIQFIKDSTNNSEFIFYLTNIVGVILMFITYLPRRKKDVWSIIAAISSGVTVLAVALSLFILKGSYNEELSKAMDWTIFGLTLFDYIAILLAGEKTFKFKKVAPIAIAV